MLRFAARTVLELGSELISSDVIAFYELIKNGFDAGNVNGASRKVGVTVSFTIILTQTRFKAALRDLDRQISTPSEPEEEAIEQFREHISTHFVVSSPKEARESYLSDLSKAKTLAELRTAFIQAQADHNVVDILDAGAGMSFDQLKTVFLTVGTESRAEEVKHAIAAKADQAPYLGEKGLGRLSAMRLGDILEVRTSTVEDARYSHLRIDWREFAVPGARIEDIKIVPWTGKVKKDPNVSGTRIRVAGLSSSWTRARVGNLAQYEFPRLTDPFDTSQRPRIELLYNGDRLSIPRLDTELLDAAHATVAARYEIADDGQPRFVCTYEARKLGFDHPVERKTVTLEKTDIQKALNTEPPIDPDALLSVGPFKIEAYWYNRRRLTGIDGYADLKTIRQLQERWSGIMLFRDRFRVFPYGEEDDDWLGLDRIALRSSGYTLNKTQFIGRAQISRTRNPELLDQTNREGLRETEEQRVFLLALRYAIQSGLRAFLKGVEKRYKDQSIKRLDTPTRTKDLKKRSREALRNLKSVVPKNDLARLQRIDDILSEYEALVAAAQARIKGAENETRQVLDLAGVGLMVEVLAHELARASENALEAIGDLKKDNPSDSYAGHVATLEAEMKGLSKRLRVLDPLSVSGRQSPAATDVVKLLKDVVDGHKQQFARRGITCKLTLPEDGLRLKLVRAYLVQILENLIANSVYWLDAKAEHESFDKTIWIDLSSNPNALRFSDNGPGIHPDHAEDIFTRFFSLKDNTRRRGLGLFIAQDAARELKGSLTIDLDDTNSDGRLTTFILDLPDK